MKGYNDHLADLIAGRDDHGVQVSQDADGGPITLALVRYERAPDGTVDRKTVAEAIAEASADDQDDAIAELAAVVAKKKGKK